MPTHPDADDSELLMLARAGDAAAFERLVAPHRRALHAHCYRMLASPHDADDAWQETLLAAWRGLASFEGRSAFGTWLYRIATHACLRLIARRPRRITSPEHGPALQGTADLGDMVPGPVWVEPWPDGAAPGTGLHEDPADALLRRESVALAFVAALQHLPGTQRAALLLREVLGYSAAEAAGMLSTSVAALNSALQRAQKTLRDRMPAVSQATEQDRLGEAGLQQLLGDFVSAWERRDIEALVRLFTEDARFTMPPLPCWFDGRAMVSRFIAERVFTTPWRLRPLQANGQPGFACYMRPEGAGRHVLGAILLLSLREGRIQALHSFLDPALYRRFGLAPELD
ncbi:RNA polymerase subunit sigma-70 [Roseateles asaccharophilus]|uniref:RNA polymerase sigma-70 factor (ECF subfamily) n=1 Tax=Roseateles asaccharophilus TaxID=582607 RepID=A0ABU2A3Q0_9BURK|nr:RNA polymerase subunit sigma-70 [Roseateles asaccharophilus]MDR7331811.1 RNA polymerase sigma-70 factor (ECF subfamily) [Roseateles asaccharophilus]